MKEKNNAAIYIAAATTTVLTTAAIVCLFLRDRNRKKMIGGRLIKVNYKYSKEFDV